MKIKSNLSRTQSFQHAAMTDIVFLLLIFFLLTSSYVTKSAIDIKLPITSTAVEKHRIDITLTLTQDGSVFINDKQVAEEEIESSLIPLLDVSTDKLVVFQAEEEIVLKDLVRIMDLAKKAGAAKLAIATDVRQTGNNNKPQSARILLPGNNVKR